MPYDNLLVSGCSFTKDWGTGWPSNLKDGLNIQNLIDCSISGAGNTHIHHSIISKLETNTLLTPDNTLVGVMWSGADRVDSLVSKNSLQEYWEVYEHFPNVCTGLTGGDGAGKGNVPNSVLQNLFSVKDRMVLSVDTFINIVSLHHYLENKGFKHFFVNWRNMDLPARDKSHNWTNDVPDIAKLFLDIEDVYSFSLKRNMLQEDDFHPTAEGFKLWSSEILLPNVKEKISETTDQRR